MRSNILLTLAGFAAIPAAAPTQVQPRLADTMATSEFRTADELQAFLASLRRLPADQQRQLLGSLRVIPNIVGGSRASIADHPWQVALIRGLASGRMQFCGGTLIAPDVVVTAAHCIDNDIVFKDAAHVDIVAGTDQYATGGERIDVSEVYVHPDWNRYPHDYDVAVLRLQRSSAAGRPISIASQPVAVGDRLMVTGWGLLSEWGLGSIDLMGVEVPVVDTGICNRPQSYNGEITPRMFCAGEQEGGKDSCQGDSGGPVSLGSGSTARLVGVVSWGEGCARRLKYGVYTRISEVASWLRPFIDH